jgi:hypothetical protein
MSSILPRQDIPLADINLLRFKRLRPIYRADVQTPTIISNLDAGHYPRR